MVKQAHFSTLKVSTEGQAAAFFAQVKFQSIPVQVVLLDPPVTKFTGNIVSDTIAQYG